MQRAMECDECHVNEVETTTGQGSGRLFLIRSLKHGLDIGGAAGND